MAKIETVYIVDKSECSTGYANLGIEKQQQKAEKHENKAADTLL